MKVEIKVRMLTAGNRSLYLEYYETGFRKRENLHLYLVADDAPNARKLNEQTYRKAQEIQAQRILTPSSFEKEAKDGRKRSGQDHDLAPVVWRLCALRHAGRELPKDDTAQGRCAQTD